MNAQIIQIRDEFNAPHNLEQQGNRCLRITTLDSYERCKELVYEERDGYTNWVNHILESCHNLQAIDEFRVRFDLDESYTDDIDGWVRFAFERKVKRFELFLSPDEEGGPYYTKECYPLSLQVFHSPQISSNISLTSLILNHVNVSDQVVEYLISNSPFLERLCVVGSESLIDLRVAGPSLSLKYVEIIFCGYLESVQLNAVNLSSFKYVGFKIEISFVNIPNLVELYIGGDQLESFSRELPDLVSTSFSQLQKLVLRPNSRVMKKTARIKIPLLSQLKQLELHVKVDSTADSLLDYSTALIKSCPSLDRFALELRCFEPFKRRKVKRPKNYPHHSLKLVEVTGFLGQTVDIEFCRYLIENAIMLEKIIINPCFLFYKGTAYGILYVEVEKAARERAEQFRSKYCLGDKLVIV
ncbi:hypothetical protein CCACVL1_13628 [Corchorus capsularis]|uniref:At1g61320/AtMIF1 LRR domain-containing protein n=1 Tax=Corchorus capsularis TaxID=210143 RepID=A0A1R3IA62_COCAP|nr:hypothetical protein CCACVL1_13628 [Corchorus capsularis]